MYYEARDSSDAPSTIRSAISDDGLSWRPEPGVRAADPNWALGSPRCVYLSPDEIRHSVGRSASLPCRLYFHHYSFPMKAGLDQQNHIISAISLDGLNFEPEPGVRIAQTLPEFEDYSVYAPEVLRLGDGSYRMYYAGWLADPLRGFILAATSRDGLNWTKHPQPIVMPGDQHDAQKASEPCAIALPDGRVRLYYEGCDENGAWRILSATTSA
jgi:predicted GH43/DUF377 family glycosyl hydrolase